VAESYHVHEFASLAGVTVRALHHYDRLGLLRPKRTYAGYRLYHAGDLERLEQIVALKFLGIPLKQIRGVLERDGRELPSALRQQRWRWRKSGGFSTVRSRRSGAPKNPFSLESGRNLPF